MAYGSLNLGEVLQLVLRLDNCGTEVYGIGDGKFRVYVPGRLAYTLTTGEAMGVLRIYGTLLAARYSECLTQTVLAQAEYNSFGARLAVLEVEADGKG